MSLEQTPVPGRRSAFRVGVLVFCCACAFFFVTGNRSVGVYDEGIMLTATMRTMAGQVLHRDFYYNYGPAHLYLLAALFKLFGPSVLVSRMLGLFSNACVVTLMFALARKLCSRSVALATAAVCALWLSGLGLNQGVIMPVSLLALGSTWLVLPVFRREAGFMRAAAAGALVGVAALYRYDMGPGLIAAHAVAILFAVLLHGRGAGERIRSAMRWLGAYLAGFIIVFAPPAMAYVRVAPLQDMLYDIVFYTAKYYRAGRGLPYPGIHLKSLEDLVVYVLIAVMALSAYLAARFSMKRAPQELAPRWMACLMAYLPVAAVMFVKGLVRIGAGQMYLCIVSCLLMAAVLWQHRAELSATGRRIAGVAALAFVGTAFFAWVHQEGTQLKHRSSTLMTFLLPSRQAPLPPYRTWCGEHNPITRGFCYVVDDDHIQAIDFLRAHTHPGETLYVGLPQHDRIFADDNLTYFATQLLPATKWSHFDPYLQNRADIQQEMIGELERNRPAYIVLDSEFDKVFEPNASSAHTGVFLLDHYIADHYRVVQRYNELTVLQRDSPIAPNGGTCP